MVSTPQVKPWALTSTATLENERFGFSGGVLVFFRLQVGRVNTRALGARDRQVHPLACSAAPAAIAHCLSLNQNSPAIPRSRYLGRLNHISGEI